MADRTHLRVADHNDIADDDPFAELTRIMGFDPRQPVKTPTQSNAAPAHSGEDDFDIDLEKELMGEFDIGHVEAAPFAARQEPLPAEAAPAMDDEFALSFEDDPQLHSEPQSVNPELFAEELTQAETQSANEAGFDLDFDNAVASAFDAPSLHHDEAPMAEELAASFGEAFSVDDVPASHGAHAVEMPSLDAEEHDFDAAVANSLEDELFFEDHEPVQNSAFTVSPAGHASSDDELGDHFADLNFSLDSEPAAAAPYRPEPVTNLVSPQWDEPSHSTANDARDADLSFELDDAFAEEFNEPVAVHQPVAPAVAPAVAQAIPMPVAAAAPVAERSLEDELNALLGVMSARTVAKEATVQQVASAPKPVSPAPVAAASVSPKPTPPISDLEWELDEQPAPQPTYQSAQPAHVEPTHAAHAHADLDDQLLDELQSQDFADGTARDADFDHDAFDAAFAQGINASQPAGHVPAPAQSWQRSTPPEPARSWSRSTPVAQQPQASYEPQPQTSFDARPVVPQPAAPQPASVTAAAATVAAMAQPAAASYRPAQESVAAPVPPKASSPRYEDMPDVETVDVPERVVALADDLDIPELHFDEGDTTASGYDDLDAEFASLLTEMNTMEMASGPARAASYEDESYSGGFKPRREADRAETVAYTAKPVDMPASAAQFSPAARGFEADDLPGSQPLSQADEFAVDELDYDPELDQDMSLPGHAEQQVARRPRGRGMFIAGIIGAIVVAGGLGALAMSFGGKGSGEAPVIVKADNTPVKVKPENPGGTVVPNQDNKVYDAVIKGAKPTEQVQDKLVNSSEEPVDVTPKEQPRVVDLAPDANNGEGAPNAAAASTGTAPDAAAASDGTDSAAPQPKSEDRIAQVVQDAEKNPDVVAVAPRKVRTMMVKSDGSLVPREDPAPAAPQVAAAEPADPAPQHVAPAGQDDAAATGTVPPAAKTTKIAKAKAQSSNTPATVPVAPQRPSDQPVDVVGEVKPDQVASIDAASAAGGGSWSIQIASQPTVESAQSTYKDLQRRYGSVLAGRTANIVKAEIAGKGTFYRVRVPAQSRNDAVNLCTSYKAAGGNCFVSR